MVGLLGVDEVEVDGKDEDCEEGGDFYLHWVGHVVMILLGLYY